MIGKWFQQQWKSRVLARMAAPVIAIALVAGFGAYEIARPVAAATGVAVGPTASPIDDNSVSALLALDHAMETVAARVTPAVVNVAVTAKGKPEVPLMQNDSDQQGNDPFQQFFGQFFGQQMPQGQGRRFQMVPQAPQYEHGVGSGVIISPDGYIVTNNHVVQNATEIRVTMSDRRVLNAKLIGTDPLTDLAVIKVDGADLPNAPWGDSQALRPGQTVLAFGNPYGMKFTVTRGIISALNRANPYTDNARKPGEFIQTDAAINPGNSGGPLVNSRGEVIGINTFLISPSGTFSGMGFAIPTQIVKPTVDALIRYGKVEHAYMGVSITDVTPENARFFHMDKAEGAVISDVSADSPAARAGLKIGDVITSVDGQKVSDAGHLQVVVGQQRPGTKLELSVLRDGKSMNVPVTVESLNGRTETASNGSGSEHGKARWGIGLQDLTPDLRQQLQAPQDLHGAVVAQVQPGSPAEDAGLARGDVIEQVNRKPVNSAADASQALRAVPAGQDALLLVHSNGGNSFRVLHPGSSKNEG